MESINQLAFLLTLFHVLSSCTCATINQPENDTDFRTEYRRQKKELLNQSDFDITIRPSILTKVNLTLSLTTLNGLDIGSQTLSTTFYFEMAWYDERLTWVPSINQTEYITFSIKEIWTPNLAIFNNINDRGILGIYEDGPIPLRVSNNGTVAWNLRVTTTTTCQADITYYPYDTQTCYLYISEWAHTSNEVDLVPYRMVKNNYTKDDEWDLIDDNVSSSDVKGIHDLLYRYVEYMLKFKRRPIWYIPLLMIPLCILSLMLPWVFLLPKSSGETIAFVLTVLLSFMVLSTFVSEKVPSVSSSTSILNVYLASVLVWGAVMTLIIVFCHCFIWKTDSDKKRTGDSGEKSTDDSGEKSTDDSGKKGADDSDQKMTNDSDKESTDDSGNKRADDSGEKSTDDSGKKRADESAKKTIIWNVTDTRGAIIFNILMICMVSTFVSLFFGQNPGYDPTVLLTTVPVAFALLGILCLIAVYCKQKFYGKGEGKGERTDKSKDEGKAKRTQQGPSSIC